MPWARQGTKHTPVATTRSERAHSVTASTQAWPQADLPRTSHPESKTPAPRRPHRPQGPPNAALTCQPPTVPSPPGQATSRKRGQEVQPHGECGREVPPRGRPHQPRARRLGLPEPLAMQHGGPGSSGRPEGGRLRWPLSLRGGCKGARREQVLLTLAQLLSSPFPGPARSTTLTQTPVTTGSSHWPKPSFLAEDRDPGSLPQSETRQSQPADGTARGPRRGQGPRADTECKAWAVDRPGPESAPPLASCLAAGKSGNLAEATSHLRAGVKTGRRAQPTVLPAPRERSESQTHRVSLSLA